MSMMTGWSRKKDGKRQQDDLASICGQSNTHELVQLYIDSTNQGMLQPAKVLSTNINKLNKSCFPV